MKKKQLLSKIFFATILLLSIVFQSFHGYEHLENKLSQKTCFHKQSTNKAELTHQHKGFDHCLVCEFTFENYLSPDNFSYQLIKKHKEIPYFFTSKEAKISYSGSLYSHRGPPNYTI